MVSSICGGLECISHGQGGDYCTLGETEKMAKLINKIQGDLTQREEVLAYFTFLFKY